MLTTPALLRLLLTTAAQSRDCARPGLGRFDRSHIRAFLATVLFPISVRGPVDFEAFRRLASIFLVEAGRFFPTPAVVAVGLWVFWLAIPFS